MDHSGVRKKDGWPKLPDSKPQFQGILGSKSDITRKTPAAFHSKKVMFNSELHAPLWQCMMYELLA